MDVRQWTVTSKIYCISGNLRLMSVTVIRAQGLSFLRPERSWRPIITISVDEYEYCETVLGTDGQNPNQKALLNLYVSNW
jgi:hypothetical protein